MIKFNITLLAVMATLGYSISTFAEDVTLTIKGSSWDADSRGFASIGGLSAEQRVQTSARRGSRISVDGHPELYAIAGAGGEFSIQMTTNQPSFRLIVEGDRFPRSITQPFAVPEESGEFEVGNITTPRAEGHEHSWPLPMAAKALGYNSALEMLADNKAAIRLGIEGSGSEGAPDYTSGAKISFPEYEDDSSDVQSTSASPFLMRVQKSAYLFPFFMNPVDTYFESEETATGTYIIVVSFEPGDPIDKDVVIVIEDSVTNDLLDPPRPWKFSPLTLKVRNGFTTDYWTWPGDGEDY